MTEITVRPRWLVLSGIIVAVIVALSISTGTAQGNTAPSSFQPGGFGNQAPAIRGQGQGQGGFGGPTGSNTRPTRQGAGQGQGNGLDLNTVASSLNLTIDQLQNELASGKTLSSVIADQGASVDQVVSALVAQTKDRLDQEVAAGRLSQEQEQQMLDNSRQQATTAITTNATGPNRSRTTGPGR